MMDYSDMTYEQAEDVLNDTQHVAAQDEMGGHAVYLASIALEKQIPQKPSYIDYDFGIFECPVCKTMMDTACDFKCWHYCMNCGQAIDWSEVDK